MDPLAQNLCTAPYLALDFLWWEALRPCLILPRQEERELDTQQLSSLYGRIQAAV